MSRAADVAIKRVLTRSRAGIGARWAWRIAYAIARIEARSEGKAYQPNPRRF